MLAFAPSIDFDCSETILASYYQVRLSTTKSVYIHMYALLKHTRKITVCNIPKNQHMSV